VSWTPRKSQQLRVRAAVNCQAPRVAGGGATMLPLWPTTS